MDALTRRLPAPGTWGYHALLAAVAIFVLGPLGGVTAAYMNFSLGFFVGGQVLAGILGSAVTFGYGAEGRHGANYMQTMAASVAGMSGMAVLVQAGTWLGLPERPWWQLSLYFLCIGMYGVGVGMLYTPFLVDRMQLTYPSGLAVANILRALTDPKLLRSSIGKLGGGTGIGAAVGLATAKLAVLGETGLSSSTFGAGMIVGARIALPGLLVATIGAELTPWLVSIGWLHEGEPFKKIGFLVALGTILGAAAIDLTLVGWQAIAELRAPKATKAPEEDWKQTNTGRLVAWVVLWGVALFLVATQVLALPAAYVAIAMGLVFLFLMVNGISLGISDSNPISSAFVITVLVLGFAGLTDPATGLLCAAILLVATSAGCDMQQDRSTGWRLGTNRTVQFRYQVVGLLMGAVLSVVFARLFMTAYPYLTENQYDPPKRPEIAADAPEEARRAHDATEKARASEAARWQSSMTFKFVGALSALTPPDPKDEPEKFAAAQKKRQVTWLALEIGLAIGFVTELLRKLIKKSAAYVAFAKTSTGSAVDFCVDAFLLPSPYASSFGGFVDFSATLWFAAGGVMTSFSQVIEGEARAAAPPPAEGEALPEDMSTTSLVGGGLIAGDSLAALALGVAGLLAALG